MTPAAERLKQARIDAKYMSATAAAEARGWTESTYRTHENGQRNYSIENAISYGRAFNVDWVWLMVGGTRGPFRELPSLTARAASAPAAITMIPTRGEVAAGLWLDIAVEVDPADFEQYPIAPNPRYPVEAQYGLIVRGTSVNRVALPGDVLHCLDLGIAAVEPEEADLVIAERRRMQEGLREFTAKRLSRHAHRYTLSPDSTDPQWKPIEFDPKKQEAKDGEDVRVLALVLAVYKPLRKRR